MVMVTHNRDLAALANRVLEMRQGVLTPLGAASVEAARPVRPIVLPAPPRHELPPVAAAEGAQAFQGLGASLWATVRRVGVASVVLFGAAFLLNEGVARYQRMRLRRGARDWRLWRNWRPPPCAATSDRSRAWETNATRSRSTSPIPSRSRRSM